MLSAMLDRKPSLNELSAALESVASSEPSAADSAVAMSSAFADAKGGIRSDLTQQVVEAALGRRTESKERSQMRRRVRSWYSSQPLSNGPGSQMLVASANPAHEAWTRIYHALYNSAEFRFRN